MTSTRTQLAADDFRIHLDAYRAGLTGLDEMIGPDGQLRPYWQPVADFLARQGPRRCNAITERIQRRIVENGLTLDSFSDPNNVEQPWRLGLLPFVLSSQDFATLEAAVTQRMRLNEALLADLYGAQTVLSNGLVPPALVFNDPSFLRPLHGLDTTVPRLTFMAVDLVRCTDGQWRVVDTHAETLAGHGYALANRVVLADLCSRMFRDTNARRISGFYQDIAVELAQRTHTNTPTIAILGPNPDHDTYLSHAYVARYMGYLLLEGSDLRVIGDQVFHKTLAGLQPIDLVVRAVEAARADPLQLDPNGFDGPPALVEAVRRNPHFIANMLGTAIVENRGLATCNANLAQALIGEDLLIPDTNRLWLGRKDHRAHLLENPDSYVIRSAFEATARPGNTLGARCLSELTADHRQQLLADIELNGACYVADERTSLATAPTWTSEGISARPRIIRLFGAACGDEFIVMPGGLAMTADTTTLAGRTSPHTTSATIESSDVWVIGEKPQGPHYSRWRISEEESQVQRVGSRLPSRVADNLYWLGRYIERADWTLRVMRQALNRGDEDLRPVRRTDAAENAIGIIESKAPDAGDETSVDQATPSLEERVAVLLSTRGNPYGIKTTFQNIRRLARQSRNRLSLDTWRLLNELTHAVPNEDRHFDDGTSDLVDRLDRHIAELAAFNGLMHENMTRNFGWRFMDLGRRMERALQMAELLRRILVPKAAEGDEPELLAFLLETADSFMTYRARYRFAPTFPLVLDLLLVDETNPRSVAYQLVEISNHMVGMPQASLDAVRTPEQRLALKLLTGVRLVDIEALRGVDDTGRRAGLARALEDLIKGIPELSDTVSRRYFSLTDEQPQRVHTRLLP